MLSRLASALLLVSVSASLQAQGSVRGVLLDSLRAMGPLAGAEVVLSPGDRRATTDDRGRFEFAGVAAGAYVLRHRALWLDSLGVAPLSSPVVVPARGTARATLSTGTRQALARDRCAGEMDGDRGIVVGEARDIRGDAAVGAIIVARWSETVVGGSGPVAPEAFIAADTIGADGWYALCGMRVGAEVLVYGQHPDGRRSGAVALVVEPALYAHDLVLGDPARRVRITGRVVNASGAAMPGAEVLGAASAAGVARSDSSGRFELQVESGSRQVVVRILGYLPAVRDVRATEEGTDIGNVVMQPVPTVLDTVVVRAAAPTREELEYEYRRRTQTGAFITEEQLRKLPQVTPNAVAALGSSWIRAAPSRPGDWGDIYFQRGSEACKPRLFVNGLDWGGRTSSDEVRSLLQMAKRIEMYRAAFAPPKFTDFDGCGALVVWLW